MSNEVTVDSEVKLDSGRRGMVLALVGPAGAGKTTLCLKLIEEFSPSITLSVSVTTRAPRPSEVQGISKHFVSRAEFQKFIDEDSLFEYEEVHGELYGQLRKTLSDTIESGADLLLDIDIRGALKFKERLPEHTVICFLLPEEFSVIEGRIKGRGSISEDELSRRLNTARAEYAQMRVLLESKDVVDYVIVNRDLMQAYAKVRAILLAERARAHRFSRSYIQSVCAAEGAAGIGK
jgi:guanylate kinase